MVMYTNLHFPWMVLRSTCLCVFLVSILFNSKVNVNMDIKNFTQFVNLLSQKMVIHTNPAFDRLATCMMVYNSMCACGGTSNQDKTNKHSECNRIYRESINGVDSIKSHLFSSTSDNHIRFFVDEIHHIKTICR